MHISNLQEYGGSSNSRYAEIPFVKCKGYPHLGLTLNFVQLTWEIKAMISLA
jgi:hypothetical protein